ncbi:MAG: hypothetical protein EBX40_01260 [Gammaproteobacteria bacterium]|nr:hypothetical protein [Gammaproteobacteria bacterium]
MGIHFEALPVYVLSVKTFKDRIAHIQKEMAKHNIPFEFVFEHDANEMDPELVLKVFGEDSPLSAAHQSLVLKHIEAQKKALAKGGGESSVDL